MCYLNEWTNEWMRQSGFEPTSADSKAYTLNGRGIISKNNGVALHSTPCGPCTILGGRMCPQTCPHPNSQNMCMFLSMAKLDYVGMIQLRTEIWGDYPGFPLGPFIYSHGSLKAKDHSRLWSEGAMRDWGRIREMLWCCFEAGWRDHEPRKQVASGSWKRQGNGFSSRAPEGGAVLPAPWF